MSFKKALLPVNRWLEPLLALFIAVMLIRVMVHLYTNGYLPQPFFYDPQDLWMDWFNTTAWSYDNGRYDNWGSIYPPLSFMFLRLFSTQVCYDRHDSYAARSCDLSSVVFLHLFFIINAILIARTFLKIDPKTALPRAFALAAGLPMLAALERGNLIMVCFTCILLGYGPLMKSARLRWLAVGLAINFKVYLIASLFPHLLRRRWRWFEGAMLATVIVYFVTFVVMGSGSPLEIYDNIVSAASSDLFKPQDFLDLWFAATYQPLIQLLDSSTFPILSILGSNNVELLSVLLPALLLTVQGSILLAASAAWLRPEAVPMYRLTNLGISMAAITAESGGYIPMFMILFIFMEKWQGFGRKWAIVVSYILCIPADIVLSRVNAPVVYESYLANHPVMIYYAVMLGPFIRPLLMMSLPFALSCVTLKDVWADILTQGWRTRWRFRHDVPIMTGPGTALPPLRSTTDGIAVHER